MKKFITLLLISIAFKAFAYDFSAVCPSGQTLYYNVLSLTEQTVALTYYEYYNAGYEQWETYYYGVTPPWGDLVIPEVVQYNDYQFTVTTVGTNAFRYCDLTSVVLPNSITVIGAGAFYADYQDLEPGMVGELVLPENLQSIGNQAFAWNTRLTKVTIPDSVKHIGQGCFGCCENLSLLTIGSGVEDIGLGAFDYCYRLDTIIVDRITPPTIGFSSFSHVPKSIPVYVPVGSKPLYEQAPYWEDFHNFMELETLTVNENKTDGFTLYFNPSKDVLFVKAQPAIMLPQEAHYRITNMLGQTVMTGLITAGSIDVSSLSPGVFVLSVGRNTQKFVIQ